MSNSAVGHVCGDVTYADARLGLTYSTSVQRFAHQSPDDTEKEPPLLERRESFFVLKGGYHGLECLLID